MKNEIADHVVIEQTYYRLMTAMCYYALAGELVTEAGQAKSSDSESETEHTEHQEIGDCIAFHYYSCMF